MLIQRKMTKYWQWLMKSRNKSGLTVWCHRIIPKLLILVNLMSGYSPKEPSLIKSKQNGSTLIADNLSHQKTFNAEIIWCLFRWITGWRHIMCAKRRPHHSVTCSVCFLSFKPARLSKGGPMPFLRSSSPNKGKTPILNTKCT